jgi:tetratricopeptide (TPR) repeat protein
MEEEDEILFSMAAVFRIESVHRLYSEDIWVVHLIMNGEEDEELNALANSIEAEIGSLDNLNTFGGLLMKMGDLQKAERYFLMLIEDTPLDDFYNKARYYSNLSLVYKEQMNYDAAISWAEKALQLVPSNLSTLAAIYNNLGLYHANKDNTVQSFNFFHKTVNIYKDILPPNHHKLAPIYMNLGLLYLNQDNSSRALEYFLKTIDIFQKSLPANHPDFAIAYVYIGTIYLSEGNYDIALPYLLKGLHV